MATTTVYEVKVYVPFFQAGQTINLNYAADGVTVTGAYDTFVQTCQTNSMNGSAYEQEMHSHDWSTMYHKLEFVAATTQAATLQAAAGTFQTALTNQNPGITINLEVHAAQVARGW